MSGFSIEPGAFVRVTPELHARWSHGRRPSSPCWWSSFAVLATLMSENLRWTALLVSVRGLLPKRDIGCATEVCGHEQRWTVPSPI